MKKKKESQTKKIDPERETRVLLESMHSDIKRVAEGHSTIVRKLEEHDTKFVEIDQRLNRIEMVVSDTNKSVKSIEKKLDNHETRIIKLEEKVHI